MKPNLTRTIFASALVLSFVLPAVNSKADYQTNSWSSGAVTNGMAADNSKRNERDRNNSSVTPGDQGNSQADIDITSRIRRSVVSGTNGFSVMARNIKIITINGKVTLRGPVKTADEKERIAITAQAIAGASNVSDQLEVK